LVQGLASPQSPAPRHSAQALPTQKGVAPPQLRQAPPPAPHALAAVPATQLPPLVQLVHVPTQLPPEQRSVVKALPSSQLTVLLV